jgi:hypothetical protein
MTEEIGMNAALFLLLIAAIVASLAIGSCLVDLCMSTCKAPSCKYPRRERSIIASAVERRADINRTLSGERRFEEQNANSRMTAGNNLATTTFDTIVELH